MKKISTCLLISIFLSSLGFLSSCTREKINYGEIHAYKSEEVEKLFDNAIKIEMVGEPIIATTEYKLSSGEALTETSTKQTYLIYVGRTKDDHLIPKSEIKESEVQAIINGGPPIVADLECTLTCSKAGSECPNKTGCKPNASGGCTTFNCGSGCETKSCSTNRKGFGFGRAIIF